MSVTARDLWYEYGIDVIVARPPSDEGSPEQWPNLFEAFERTVERVRGDATDNAIRACAEALNAVPNQVRRT